MLSREAILGFKDTRIGRVDVPEMGGEVCVANLTAAEADQVRRLGNDDTPIAVSIVILGACDESGARLFTQKDRDALSKLPASAVGKIAQAVLAHNGLTGDSQEDVKND